MDLSEEGSQTHVDFLGRAARGSLSSAVWFIIQRLPHPIRQKLLRSVRNLFLRSSSYIPGWRESKKSASNLIPCCALCVYLPQNTKTQAWESYVFETVPSCRHVGAPDRPQCTTKKDQKAKNTQKRKCAFDARADMVYRLPGQGLFLGVIGGVLFRNTQGSLGGVYGLVGLLFFVALFVVRKP